MPYSASMCRSAAAVKHLGQQTHHLTPIQVFARPLCCICSPTIAPQRLLGLCYPQNLLLKAVGALRTPFGFLQARTTYMKMPCLHAMESIAAALKLGSTAGHASKAVDTIPWQPVDGAALTFSTFVRLPGCSDAQIESVAELHAASSTASPPFW